MASVRLTVDAQAQFGALPDGTGRVLAIIDRMAKWPDVSKAKPLRKEFAGQFRIRTGDYRVQFRPVGDTVTITKVGHRDGFYDD